MKVRDILLVAALCGTINQIRAQGLLGSFAGAARGIMGGMGGIIPSAPESYCSHDISKEFEKATYDFTLRLYKRVAFYNKDHFVISPLSMWLSLAAIAEGADGLYQRQLLTSLNLPEERCLRDRYYEMALSREKPGNDVRFLRKRLMVFDQDQRVNNTWSDYIKRMNLLDISFAPIKADAEAVAMQLKDYLGARSVPRLGGNSVLVDSLDYEGLWTTAFPEAKIEKAPFYNDAGQNIGMVDYLKIKKRVKLAHLPLINAKVLELPVGDNGRYRMFIAVGMSNMGIRNAMEMLVNSLLTEVLSLLKESLIPLEVAIPRFALNFEYEASGVLDEIGVGSPFKKPDVTWLISYPPAQPASFYQRVSIKVDSPGISQLSKPEGLARLNPLVGLGSIASGMATGLAAAVGRDFVANRPFMFGLFDTEVNTCLFAGAFSQPGVTPLSKPEGLARLNSLVGLGSIASGMATGLAAAVGRDFVANRPFMFGLFDTEVNTCLFAGAFSQPGL